MRFKDWTEFNKFMQEYAYCCCQNCVGYNGDMDKGQFVCMRTLSPVRFDLLCVCTEWQNHDGKILDDYDRSIPYKFSNELLDEIVGLNGEYTFEELKEYIESNEEVKE